MTVKDSATRLPSGLEICFSNRRKQRAEYGCRFAHSDQWPARFPVPAPVRASRKVLKLTEYDTFGVRAAVKENDGGYLELQPPDMRRVQRMKQEMWRTLQMNQVERGRQR
jgi:hypothetical protein